MTSFPIDCIADTSAIIGVLRRDAAIEQKISGKRFTITFVTLAELSLGFKGDAAGSGMVAHPGGHR